MLVDFGGGATIPFVPGPAKCPMSRRFQFSLKQVLAVIAILCATAWLIHECASTGPNYRPSEFSLAAGAVVLCGATIYLVGLRVAVLLYAGIMGVAFLVCFLIGLLGLVDLFFFF
jgi:hypothetical protein